MKAKQFQAIRLNGGTVVVDYINRECSYVLYEDGVSMCYDFKSLDFDAYVKEIKKHSIYRSNKDYHEDLFVTWAIRMMSIFGRNVVLYAGRNEQTKGDNIW